MSVDGTPRRFVHDENGRVIGEYGATGTVLAEHIWLMPDTDEGGWGTTDAAQGSSVNGARQLYFGSPDE